MYKKETNLETLVRRVLSGSILIAGSIYTWSFFGHPEDERGMPFIIYVTFWLLVWSTSLLNLRGFVRSKWISPQQKERCLAKVRGVYSAVIPAITASAAIFIVLYLGQENSSEEMFALTHIPLLIIIFATIILAWVFRDDIDDINSLSYGKIVKDLVFSLIIFSAPIILNLIQKIVTVELNDIPQLAILVVLTFIVAVISTVLTNILWRWVEPSEEAKTAKASKARCLKRLSSKKTEEPAEQVSHQKNWPWGRSPGPLESEKPIESQDSSRFMFSLEKSIDSLKERQRLRDERAVMHRSIEVEGWEAEVYSRQKQLEYEEGARLYRKHMRSVDRQIRRQNRRY